LQLADAGGVYLEGFGELLDGRYAGKAPSFGVILWNMFS
jgi:hypothetical protein